MSDDGLENLLANFNSLKLTANSTPVREGPKRNVLGQLQEPASPIPAAKGQTKLAADSASSADNSTEAKENSIIAPPQPLLPVTAEAQCGITADPPIETSESAEDIIEPLVETAEPLVETAEPLGETTEPLVGTTQPLAETTAPLGETREPLVGTAVPPPVAAAATPTPFTTVEDAGSSGVGETSTTDPFEDIRELDDKERWFDRNAVITNLEHQENKNLVREVVDGLVDTLPLSREQESEETPCISTHTQLDKTLDLPPPANQPSSGFSDPVLSLNTTFDLGAEQQAVAAGGALDATFELTNDIQGASVGGSLNTTFNLTEDKAPLDSTFNLIEKKEPLDSTFNLIEKKEPLDSTFNLAEATLAAGQSNTLNATFEVSQDHLEDTAVANTIVEANNTVTGDQSKTLNTTFKLEEESFIKVSASKTLNSTFELEKSSIVKEEVKLAVPSETESDLSSLNQGTISTDIKVEPQTVDRSLDIAGDQPCATVEVSETNTQALFDEQPIVVKPAVSQVKKEPIVDDVVLTAAKELTQEEQPIATGQTVPGERMAEEEEIPIPRGTYTINWDEIDEFADPFAMSKPKGAKAVMANSPPIRSNAEPPKFDNVEPLKETPADTPSVSSVQPAVPEARESSVDVNKPEAQAEAEEPLKKKSPLKKKKVPAKGGASRFAEFKKKQAAKLKQSEDFNTDIIAGSEDSTVTTSPATTTTTDTAVSQQDEPLPPPASYNFDDCDDPFGTKSKVPLSPVNTTGPPAAFADPATSEAFNEDVDPFKPRKTLMANSPPMSPKIEQTPASPKMEQAPANPFMTAAELSSPDALKVIAAKKEKAAPRLIDSPAPDEMSTATTTSVSREEAFEDAVDELPEEEFVPAVPEMFNTTADIQMLDKAASTQPSFRESALARQSLYRNFDPLVDVDGAQANPSHPSSRHTPNVATLHEQSVYLMGGGDSPAASPRVPDVDRLLDITVAPSSAQVSQNEMDELKLMYEEKLLEKDRQLQSYKDKVTVAEDELKLANARVAEYDLTMNSLLKDRDLADVTSQETISKVKEERDTYAEGLHQVETSFTELHKRYDQMRLLLIQCRNNERMLTEHNTDLKSKLSDYGVKFDECKTECQDKLSTAHSEVQQMKSDNRSQLAKLQMAKRKDELTISSLQQQINQKVSENDELMKICDNLIQSSGGS